MNNIVLVDKITYFGHKRKHNYLFYFKNHFIVNPE